MEKILEYPLDGLEVIRKKKSLKRKLLTKSHFMTLKVAILSGSTVGEIPNVLELFLLDYDIKPEFFIGEYDCFYEDAVFENHALIEFAPDIIYVHTTQKNLKEKPEASDSIEMVMQKKANIMEHFQQVWDCLNKKYNCVIIQNNFEYLPYRILGNNDCVFPNGCNSFVDTLNASLHEYAREHKNFHVNDIHYLSAWYGLERWFNDAEWYMYKYAINVDAIALLCSSIAKIIKSLYGKNKKAIAVDLDNTLWGGIIGDDGLNGIELGSETARGMAFSDFQYYLKQLSKIGISLNVCSKNEEKNAKEGFSHGSSVLKVDDFVCFVANWEPKDRNISTIAQQLNILPESIVFLDDNPAERQIVSEGQLGVEVPALGGAEGYLRILDQLGYFEVTQLSEDDKNRNKFYKDNMTRATEQTNYENYSDYLKSLQMCVNMQNINPQNITRVVQLINKTNQFNFTTIRLSQKDVEALIDDGGIVFCANMSDKYGDNGIVSALVAEITKNLAEITVWVMSCRVFKRELELAMFDEFICLCRIKGINEIRGRYIPTAKNAYVRDLYEALGFTKVSEQDGVTVWELCLEEYKEPKCKVMEVLHNER